MRIIREKADERKSHLLERTTAMTITNNNAQKQLILPYYILKNV